MKCLVTGGDGFIGRHLVKKLAELGHLVYVLDLTPVGAHVRQDNVFHFVGDVTKDNWTVPVTDLDWCFHLAAMADVVPSITMPALYHRVNVDGTVNVLIYCRHAKLKRFVYASSTSIYGIPIKYPTPEDETPAPQYPYALTKYVAEQYVMHWSEVYHLPSVILRPTTVYGTGMKSRGGYGSAFKVFMAQKANNAPFTVVGDGSQARDFVFVDDVVDAFIQAAESAVSGEVFNVGCGEPRTINDVIRLLGGGEINYLPKRPGEPDRTWADIRKIYALLCWEPKFALEDGMKVMLEHIDDWKNETVWTPESIKEATKSWFEHLS